MDELLLSRIEDASLNASAAPQQRWIDGWIVRYCPGKARRARCVNAVAAGRLDLAARLELARAVYEEAGLPMVLRITPFTQPAGLDADLAQLGYAGLDTTRVQYLPLGDALEPAPLPRGLEWVPLNPEAFAQGVGALRGSPPDHFQAHAHRMHLSPIPYRGFAIRREADQQILSCGQFAREGEWVGLYDIFTHSSARGQGLAKMLCERLLSQVTQQGARMAYLQVESTNDAALRLYARLGFVSGYNYHYREAPRG